MSEYWTACQTMPGREHLIRAEIEKGNRGAFVPTYARAWISDGKVSAGERATIQGYVFFLTEPDRWGEVANIEGVQRVLTMEFGDRRIAKPISAPEMVRMMLAHATGEHNDMRVCLTTGKPRERVRRRRPRPSKRIRKSTNGNRTDMAA